MTASEPTFGPPSKNRRHFTVDSRLIIIFLAAIIGGLLIAWKPGTHAPNTSDRTIQVAGEATVKAVPDEFVFFPTYDFKTTNRTTTLAQIDKKSTDITNKLKVLGVADTQIKTNASSYDSTADTTPEKATYSLRLTVTVSSHELAQKVQDYLVTTTPTGSVSPQATFSDSKRKELEVKARDDATKDARAKAEQSAKNLGFTIDKVKTVSDGAGFDAVMPLDSSAAAESGNSPTTAKLAVQPGENELNYSVSVTYFVR